MRKVGEVGMSRLIDADALSAAMYHEAFETDTDMQKWDSGCWIRYKMFEQAVKAAPTIEAEPARTGHWKRRRLRVTASCLYKCSACGQCVNTADIWAYKFCYHCGAKMDEVSE